MRSVYQQQGRGWYQHQVDLWDLLFQVLHGKGEPAALMVACAKSPYPEHRTEVLKYWFSRRPKQMEEAYLSHPLLAVKLVKKVKFR
jgi:hypothetical protein